MGPRGSDCYQISEARDRNCNWEVLLLRFGENVKQVDERKPQILEAFLIMEGPSLHQTPATWNWANVESGHCSGNVVVAERADID